MSDDRLEAWELALASGAVQAAIYVWAVALGGRSDIYTLWREKPALACEAINDVVTIRGKDICLLLAREGEFSTAAFLDEVQREWNHYRYDFINATLAGMGIAYEL